MNYIDRDEYYEKNIIILMITKNYGMRLEIEKFKNLILYENQIDNYKKQINGFEKLFFCSFPIVSLDNFKVLGMIYEGNITKATKSICRIRGTLFSEFEINREYYNGFFMKYRIEGKLLYFLITHKLSILKAIRHWEIFKIVLSNGEEKYIKMINDKER